MMDDLLLHGLALSSLILENGRKLPGECIETAFLAEFPEAESARKFIGGDPTKVEDFIVRIVVRACRIYKVFDRVQNFDPLQFIEKFAQEGEENFLCSFGLMQLQNRILKEVLEERKDSYWACPVPLYLDILDDLNFKLVMEMPIKDKDNNKFYVFYRSDGLLLRFDTHRGKIVNSAELYYNWKPNPDYWEGNGEAILSSGYWGHPDNKPEERISEKPKTELVRIGHHDARVGIRGTIEALEKDGEFLPQWIESPLVWLCHHGDKKKPYDHDYYDKVNASRRKMLPPQVQEMIGEIANEDQKEKP